MQHSMNNLAFAWPAHTYRLHTLRCSHAFVTLLSIGHISQFQLWDWTPSTWLSDEQQRKQKHALKGKKRSHLPTCAYAPPFPVRVATADFTCRNSEGKCFQWLAPGAHHMCYEPPKCGLSVGCNPVASPGSRSPSRSERRRSADPC